MLKSIDNTGRKKKELPPRRSKKALPASLSEGEKYLFLGGSQHGEIKKVVNTCVQILINGDLETYHKAGFQFHDERNRQFIRFFAYVLEPLSYDPAEVWYTYGDKIYQSSQVEFVSEREVKRSNYKWE